MLQQAVARVVVGRTSFVVAHRLSTIRGADKILVVKDGEIVEQGTPEELLTRGGDFARMYQEFLEPFSEAPR
jgi:ATP-binding cassette subfamily B protein